MASCWRVPKRFHAVSTAEAELFGGFDRWRRTASGSLVDDDLTQVLDAVFGEGGHAMLTHAVDPEAAVFGEHVDRQLVQPVFVLAEQVGDVADREDGCDPRHDQAASHKASWRTLPISLNLRNTRDSTSRIRRSGSCSRRSALRR